MPKPVTASFSDRTDDQKRLRKVGGSIMFSKGKPVFSFPSMDAYREWQQLGAEAYKRRVGLL
ncbi:hypothetical protein ABE385_04580 [Bacillus velezensis]|uniref:hypothetical protein n=1 Tax=Bacillus velezensis TaxID=492670 RepID=UPI00100B355E|nr:hypothetical protein [Bacillus velezensis]MED1774033.1 hypothetical protein [Bacillus velezensis]RXK26689.1 hypothetical protein P42_16285 [Bacillus velezensis]